MCIAVVLVSLTAQAKWYYWEGGVSADWSDVANWKCDYEQNGTATAALELPGEAGGGKIYFGDDAVTEINPCVYDYDMDPANATGANWSGINVGIDAPATVTMNGGVWYQQAALGIGGGSFGQWIHNGGVFDSLTLGAKEVHVGSSSQGYLEISGGEIRTARVRVCANTGTANSEAVVKGGKIYASQWIDVGQNATGSMTVQNGTVETPDLRVSNDSVLTLKGGIVEAGTLTFNGTASHIDFQGGVLTTTGMTELQIQGLIGTRLTSSMDPNTTGVEMVYEDMGSGVFDIYAYSPYWAFNPTPSNGATGVDVDAVLSWEQDASVSGEGLYYDVYFGTDPNNLPKVKTTTADSSDFTYDPAGMDYDADYFWHVNTIDPNDGGNPFVRIEGVLWSFSTVPAVPVINPENSVLDDVLVAQGDSVSFEVEATSVSPLYFQWYKCTGTEPAFDEDGLPTDTAVGSQIGPISTSPAVGSYDITSAQVSDEGYYYCQVWNDAGVSQAVYSDAAMLMTERLAGHWKMDGTLDDSSGNGWTGTYYFTGDPVYDAAGKDGSALSLVNDPNHVRIDGSEDAFNFFHLGLTVHCWVKTDNTWSGLICKQDRDGYDPWRGFIFEINGVGEAFLNYREVGGVSTSTIVTDEQWHMLTATYDGATGNMAIYVDGEEEDAASYPNADVLLAENPLVFGVEQVTGATPLLGLMDDIRVYTYAMADTEVLDLYNELTEPDKNLCLLEYGAEVDVSGPEGEPDCKVDLYDFAEIASGWLTCGLYPACQ